jgi:hypothetical protein
MRAFKSGGFSTTGLSGLGTARAAVSPARGGTRGPDALLTSGTELAGCSICQPPMRAIFLSTVRTEAASEGAKAPVRGDAMHSLESANFEADVNLQEARQHTERSPSFGLER